MLRWNARIADVGLEQEKALSLLDGIYSTVMIRDSLESYFFYEIKRSDIKGKAYLRTLGKYYIVDIGLCNYLLGFCNRDRGHAIENVVYFELLRRGYDVAIGKIGNAEVDFIATTANEKKYIQVTESMMSEDVRKRELAPLQSIRDNYKKPCCPLSRVLMLPTTASNPKTLSTGCLTNKRCISKGNLKVFAVHV